MISTASVRVASLSSRSGGTRNPACVKAARAKSIGPSKLQPLRALRKLKLPCKRVGDDGLQIMKTRLPFERGTDKIGGGDDVCRVARPAARELDLEIDAGDLLYGVDYLPHGESPAVTAIERRRLAAAAQIRQCFGMRGRGIAPVNIYSYA